jgi:predicted nucleic acid-binding protein
MNLLQNSTSIFITESAWLALVNTKDEDHFAVKNKFKDLLDQKFRLITSTYVLDNVLEKVKAEHGKAKANEFIEIIERSMMGNFLRIVWLSRRLRLKAVKDFVDGNFVKVSQSLNIHLIKQKRYHYVFTKHSEIYEKLDLVCLKF